MTPRFFSFFIQRFERSSKPFAGTLTVEQDHLDFFFYVYTVITYAGHKVIILFKES